MIFATQFEIVPWTCVLLMPKELVSSSAGKTRTFFAFSIVACVLIAYVLMKNAASLNSSPLENLMEVIQIHNDTETAWKSEYQIMN